MAFTYLTNLPLEKAVECLMSAVRDSKRRLAVELVRTTDANGRVCGEAVRAKICVPHYHASAMDGIALKAERTFGATETTPVVLGNGEFILVDTGDMVPENCDAVVMIEDVIFTEDGAVLYAAAAPWQHIRQIGEDFCADDMILTSFTVITPVIQGALLASGILEVLVFCRPEVGIIPTGDELVLPTEIPEAGDIIEFNSTIFSSMLRDWGCIPKVYPITPDDPKQIERMLKKAAAECDAVLLSAGSSAGRDDYSCRCMEHVGRVLFHGVAIRPGKPAAAGMIGDVPVLGVPGYPVSAILIMENLFRPVMRWLCGFEHDACTDMETASISRQITSSLKYQEFVRVRLGRVGGKLVASPLPRGAGIVSSFAKADGIMVIEQNREGYCPGDPVPVKLMKGKEEIESALVITGSHDPLIDEAADLMKLADRRMRTASSHVGSMGGILALKNREAHLAGIHILNEKDGSYNVGTIRSCFSSEEVVLVRGVKRQQGLMVAKGNPKGITGIESLQYGIRYVNRQGGSGTRHLLDYLCARAGVRAEQVSGYTREEYTHTAVAAQIAAGTADAGMGIFSAAQIYGLDFIPLYQEHYDFLVLASCFGLAQVKRFLDVLGSEELAGRLMRMGGYDMHGIGEVISWEAGR